MRIKISDFQLVARRAGGLFIGVRLHFPINIVDIDCGEPAIDDHVPTNMRYTMMWANIGLLFWQFSVEFHYNIRPVKS